MPATPKRLSGPAQVATGPATVYTVPALTKTLIRHLHISNPSGSAVTFTASIGASAAATRLYDVFSIAANSVQDIWWYQIMEAAEILQFAAGTNNILVVVVNGDEFTLG